jgi:glycosyltransferase involved in cell wall biosynthesis
VVTVYDLIYELFPGMFPGIEGDAVRDLMRRAVESADVVICISETTRQHVVDTYDDVEERTIVTYMGVSDVFRADYSPTGGTNGSGPYLLYVGARRGYKQFETLARAYGAWVGRHETDLVVVGGVWTAVELELLGELGIGEKVRLLSGVDDATLADLYRGSLALVFPSLYEGFGIPIVEAMSVGCPVVASRIPTTEEVAGDVPIYFEPGGLESLHSALTTVAEGRRAEAKIRLGKQRAEQFSWERTARETLEVYRGL